MIKARRVAIVVGTGESPAEAKVLELAFLVRTWQVRALEERAGLEGQTVGQLLRRIIGDFLDGAAASRVVEKPQPEESGLF